MKKNNILLRTILSCLVIWWLFSVTFAATTQRWRDVLNQLRDDWRTDDEIRQAMKDLWYNPTDYLWVDTNPKLKVINWSTASKTTPQWREILNQLRKDWRTDDEIKRELENLWLDSSGYFPTSNNIINNNTTDWSTYISRSCKPYTIQYIQSLNAYTSPDLKKKEYFVNIDYLKRYIDSKNAQNAECYIWWWWITTSYTDTYAGSDRYTAPNWKVYFISQGNWGYTSNELGIAKSFATVDELKNYIRQRNPLINMWVTNNSSQLYNTQYIQANIIPETEELRNIIETLEHGSSETWQTTSETQTETKSESQTEAEKNSNIISELRNQLFPL